MIKRSNIMRSWLLVLGLTAIISAALPSRAHAQQPCICPNVYLKIDPNIPCNVTVCVRDFTGLNCYTVAPGALYPEPCNGMFNFYIPDCYGNYVLVAPGSPVNCICMAPGCCIDAFVVQDANHCWVIKVQRSACLSC